MQLVTLVLAERTRIFFCFLALIVGLFVNHLHSGFAALSSITRLWIFRGFDLLSQHLDHVLEEANPLVLLLDDSLQRLNITVQRIDVPVASSPEELVDGSTVDAINNYYSFTINGLLVGNVHISITRYVDNPDAPTVLGGIETIDVRAGDSYTINDVTSFTYAGITYQLTRIFVDGYQLEEGSLNEVMTSGQYIDVGRGNSDIKLYYTPVAASQAVEG